MAVLLVSTFVLPVLLDLQACTVAADPLTKFLEVCHVSQPDADIPVNMMDNPWPARVK